MLLIPKTQSIVDDNTLERIAKIGLKKCEKAGTTYSLKLNASLFGTITMDMLKAQVASARQWQLLHSNIQNPKPLLKGCPGIFTARRKHNL